MNFQEENFDPRDYIKMKLPDAENLAAKRGYVPVLVEMNGVSDIITFKLSDNIIYFRVSNGVVVGAFLNQ